MNVPDDDIARRVLVLFLEQSADSEWPRPLLAGAWNVLCPILYQRPALGPVALELAIFEIATAQLRAIGSGGSWAVSTSCASYMGLES